MEKITDKEIKLMKASIEVNQESQFYCSDDVKAKLQVHYHYEQTPQITCTIDVGEDDKPILFHLMLEYQVPKMEKETQTQYIDQIGCLIKPRIEDLINYVIDESGHQEAHC